MSEQTIQLGAISNIGKDILRKFKFSPSGVRQDEGSVIYKVPLGCKIDMEFLYYDLVAVKEAFDAKRRKVEKWEEYLGGESTIQSIAKTSDTEYGRNLKSQWERGAQIKAANEAKMCEFLIQADATNAPDEIEIRIRRRRLDEEDVRMYTRAFINRFLPDHPSREDENTASAEPS